MEAEASLMNKYAERLASSQTDGINRLFRLCEAAEVRLMLQLSQGLVIKRAPQLFGLVMGCTNIGKLLLMKFRNV